MSKETLRKAIAKHVREYLRRGGSIEVVPRVIYCPSHMHWARARGWDYTPWNKLGGPDFFADQLSVGDGCYMKKPAKTED
jgi:hypothetical protein